jgi:hypothetical protein
MTPRRPARRSIAALPLMALALAGCAGPPVLERQVIGYDEVTSRLDQQLLLLNIARVDQGRPVHFTSTSSIAATFDWSTTLGVVGQYNPQSIDDLVGLNLGASARENPTFSILPLSGQAFTQRILTPFKDDIFEFLVFQGGAIDQIMRLLAGGVERQRADGSFERFVENSPQRPEEYAEFRRIAAHLRWLNDHRRLFVRSLVFEETLLSGQSDPPSAADAMAAARDGLHWTRGADGRYALMRTTQGRVVVTNVDPMTLGDAERARLNERIRRNPANFVYLDVRPDGPGGEFPIRGGVKLRSMLQILSFVAHAARATPEPEVAPDPRTGPLAENPRATLGIVIGPAPPGSIASIVVDGQRYSVADTAWDREQFATLGHLFQTAVGNVGGAGIPITISK